MYEFLLCLKFPNKKALQNQHQSANLLIGSDQVTVDRLHHGHAYYQ